MRACFSCRSRSACSFWYSAVPSIRFTKPLSVRISGLPPSPSASGVAVPMMSVFLVSTGGAVTPCGLRNPFQQLSAKAFSEFEFCSDQELHDSLPAGLLHVGLSQP